MAHTYIRLDFGTDEEKAQQARHKLDGWKQAFRLDKKLQYKLERPENEADSGATGASESAAKPAGEKAAKAVQEEKAKSGSKGGSKGKEKPAAKPKTSESAVEKPAVVPANGKVGLLVRLYFSSHEKLSEQRWIDRIPSEEPFRSASPKVIHQGDAEFEKTDQQFESLD
jgi:hypothetical protein